MLNIKTYKKSNTKRKENITCMVLFHLLSTQIRILEFDTWTFQHYFKITHLQPKTNLW